MKVYDATEQAYKSGYNAGVKEFEKRLKDSFGYGWLLGSGLRTRAEAIAKELCEKNGINKPERGEEGFDSTAIQQEAQPYFSPDDVRKMSDKEVRRNYQAILKSMEKWG